MLLTSTKAAMKDSFYIIEFTIMLIVLASCASTGSGTIETTKVTADSPVTSVQISDNDREKFKAGLGAMDSNDFTTAERIFSELIEKQPYMAGPYCNNALIFLKKLDYQKSLDTINQAITLNNGIAQAYNIRAQALVATGKIKEAESDYLKAIELDPAYTYAHYNLALLYDIYYQDIGKAIQHYEKYLSLLEQPDKATKDWIAHLKGAQ